jgi:hypothetical protein
LASDDHRGQSEPVRSAQILDDGKQSSVPYDQCFVVGCERSGTTPLVKLLAGHPAMAMGMERYKYVLRDMRRTRNPDLLAPEHFEPSRFLDFRVTDTNHIPPATFRGHYESVERRLQAGTVRYFGDKLLPPNVWTTLAIAERFPRSRFIFIYRDVLAVTNSFDRRALDPADTAWPEQNDHEHGYTHWVDSFDVADALIALVGPKRVFVVRCESLFEGHVSGCDAMFRFLSLDPSLAHERWGMVTAGWAGRPGAGLELTLSPEVQDSLMRRTDPVRLARYEAYARACAEQRYQPPPGFDAASTASPGPSTMQH